MRASLRYSNVMMCSGPRGFDMFVVSMRAPRLALRGPRACGCFIPVHTEPVGLGVMKSWAQPRSAETGKTFINLLITHEELEPFFGLCLVRGTRWALIGVLWGGGGLSS